jgi:hypothetical protein
MPEINDFPARGRIKQVNGDTVVFQPAGTNYEIHLKSSDGPYAGPVDQPIQGLIRVNARKLWTVPSGGNFVAPIFGSPRTIQGRVKWIEAPSIVVQAGTHFVVEVPSADAAIDLANGVIELGSLVNVTAMPGATFALLAAAVKT